MFECDYYEEHDENHRKWRENSNGNMVCIDGDELVATVFRPRKSKMWCIILNRLTAVGIRLGYRVEEEFFEDADGACKRAEAIMDGATDCTLSLVSERVR